MFGAKPPSSPTLQASWPAWVERKNSKCHYPAPDKWRRCQESQLSLSDVRLLLTGQFTCNQSVLSECPFGWAAYRVWLCSEPWRGLPCKKTLTWDLHRRCCKSIGSALRGVNLCMSYSTSGNLHQSFDKACQFTHRQSRKVLAKGQKERRPCTGNTLAPFRCPVQEPAITVCPPKGVPEGRFPHSPYLALMSPLSVWYTSEPARRASEKEATL